MEKLLTIKGFQFKVKEDEDKIYFTEVSNRKNKAHFTFSKNKEDNQLAEYGLKTFWTEVYS